MSSPQAKMHLLHTYDDYDDVDKTPHAGTRTHGRLRAFTSRRSMSVSNLSSVSGVIASTAFGYEDEDDDDEDDDEDDVDHQHRDHRGAALAPLTRRLSIMSLSSSRSSVPGSNSSKSSAASRLPIPARPVSALARSTTTNTDTDDRIRKQTMRMPLARPTQKEMLQFNRLTNPAQDRIKELEDQLRKALSKNARHETQMDALKRKHSVEVDTLSRQVRELFAQLERQSGRRTVRSGHSDHQTTASGLGVDHDSTPSPPCPASAITTLAVQPADAATAHMSMSMDLVQLLRRNIQLLSEARLSHHTRTHTHAHHSLDETITETDGNMDIARVELLAEIRRLSDRNNWLQDLLIREKDKGKDARQQNRDRGEQDRQR